MTRLRAPPVSRVPTPLLVVLNSTIAIVLVTPRTIATGNTRNFVPLPSRRPPPPPLVTPVNVTRLSSILNHSQPAPSSSSSDDFFCLLTSASPTLDDATNWIIDSGCTSHMTCNRSAFTDNAHSYRPSLWQTGTRSLRLVLAPLPCLLWSAVQPTTSNSLRFSTFPVSVSSCLRHPCDISHLLGILHFHLLLHLLVIFSCFHRHYERSYLPSLLIAPQYPPPHLTFLL